MPYSFNPQPALPGDGGLVNPTNLVDFSWLRGYGRSKGVRIVRAGRIQAGGCKSVYLARDLRLGCSCAHCISETTGDELLDPRSVPADVHPLSISQVGRYAIHIQWSDGHSTGIYRFKHLRALDPSMS